MSEDSGIQAVSAGFFSAFFGSAGTYVDNWRRKRALKAMLKDSRFSFRSFSQLHKRAGVSEEETRRLLVAIGARPSESAADSWTLKAPPNR
jgi:hypothetical protein